MDQRYISNNMPAQALSSTPATLLQTALEQVIKTTPPLHRYSTRQLGGLYSGYTGLAYLFLQLSSTHPHIRVHGHSLHTWARRYLEGDRGELRLERGNCGIACEKLSYEALLVCLTHDHEDLVNFLSNMPMLLGPYPHTPGDPFSSELIYGRSGTLYLLRIIKKWAPQFSTYLDSPMHRIAERIMRTDDDGRGNWEWHGKRYFGAGHGEIGIITQLILTEPSLASELEDRLKDLLALQMSDGNWPSSERKMREGKPAKLTQWCHGAPGFIYSLESLLPYFPHLHEQIIQAISKAQHVVWRHGLLTKEPSLCHGIFGNALALPRGPTRDHFLALATAEAVNKVKAHDPKLFQAASYDKEWAVLLNYYPSAAWAWAVCDQDSPPLIMYNDV